MQKKRENAKKKRERTLPHGRQRLASVHSFGASVRLRTCTTYIDNNPVLIAACLCTCPFDLRSIHPGGGPLSGRLDLPGLSKDGLSTRLLSYQSSSLCTAVRILTAETWEQAVPRRAPRNVGFRADRLPRPWDGFQQQSGWVRGVFLGFSVALAKLLSVKVGPVYTPTYDASARRWFSTSKPQARKSF